MGVALKKPEGEHLYMPQFHRQLAWVHLRRKLADGSWMFLALSEAAMTGCELIESTGLYQPRCRTYPFTEAKSLTGSSVFALMFPQERLLYFGVVPASTKFVACIVSSSRP